MSAVASRWSWDGKQKVSWLKRDYYQGRCLLARNTVSSNPNVQTFRSFLIQELNNTGLSPKVIAKRLELPAAQVSAALSGTGQTVPIERFVINGYMTKELARQVVNNLYDSCTVEEKAIAKNRRGGTARFTLDQKLQFGTMLKEIDSKVSTWLYRTPETSDYVQWMNMSKVQVSQMRATFTPPPFCVEGGVVISLEQWSEKLRTRHAAIAEASTSPSTIETLMLEDHDEVLEDEVEDTDTDTEYGTDNDDEFDSSDEEDELAI